MGAWALALLLGALPAGAAEPIRVALHQEAPLVDVGAAGFVTVQDGATHRALFGVPGGRVLRIGLTAPGLEVIWGPDPLERKSLAMPGVRLTPQRGPLRIGTRDYGGVLEVWRNGRGLLVVNELDLEEYVAGTVRAEASDTWPAEALRAVAVVARTYAVFVRQRAAGKLFHVAATSQDQNYLGRPLAASPAWEAAQATAGQVLTWRGRVFPTFYHSDSGGFTEPPQAVFSGAGIPPLPGVRDEFSQGSPNQSWAVSLPLAVVRDRLRRAGVDVGEVTGLTVAERTPSLRVAWIAVEHTRGASTLKGTEFRRFLGYDVIKSTLFVPVVASDGTVRFEGRGWGHGVGLSQFGAKGMAERGYTHPHILEYYYPGTRLETLK